MKDKLVLLLVISLCLFISFVCSVVSIATNQWSSRISLPFISHYRANDSLLWVIGCVVFTLLGIVCLCISAVVVLSRFFDHGRGRAILGGILSIFSGIMFTVTQIIFMRQEPPGLVWYNYSFGLMWCAIPFAIAAGIVFFTLQDSKFLM